MKDGVGVGGNLPRSDHYGQHMRMEHFIFLQHFQVLPRSFKSGGIVQGFQPDHDVLQITLLFTTRMEISTDLNTPDTVTAFADGWARPMAKLEQISPRRIISICHGQGAACINDVFVSAFKPHNDIGPDAIKNIASIDKGACNLVDGQIPTGVDLTTGVKVESKPAGNGQGDRHPTGRPFDGDESRAVLRNAVGRPPRLEKFSP